MKQNKYDMLVEALTLDVNNKKYYEDFDTSTFGDSLKPGSMPAPYFYDWVIDEAVKKAGPDPIVGIEVGSFLGYSAIAFAKKLKQHNPKSKLICIDTWLGSPEHYTGLKSDGANDLSWVNGYPTMYYKFISNVILNDVQDIIVPLPFPSTIGYKVLRDVFGNIDIKADFAYIDGSHEEDEVYMDLHYYYKLIKKGGCLCGDDWAWDAVRSDVTKFSNNNNLQVNLHPNNVHWAIQTR